MRNIMHVRLGWLMVRMLVILVVLQVSCERRSSEEAKGVASTDGDVAAATEVRPLNWKKVIYECIEKIEKSDAVFYVCRRRATGREVAEHMRNNMKVILREKSIPEPFGRNAGIFLAMITRYEGYAMDGVTGPPDPFELEVKGQRLTVYEWLKQELGLKTLPGEEEGHQILLPLYEAVVTPEVLRQWEEYLDKCIDVTKRAENCAFCLSGKYYTVVEAARIFSSNREDALKYLKYPDIKHRDDRELYTASTVLVRLILRPQPTREEFSDPKEFSRELTLWATGSPSYVECNSVKVDVIDWLIRNAGKPPQMPKLKKRR